MKNIKRNHKKDNEKSKSKLQINKGIQGDSIEIMLERIREGEGEESISERDLVYNDAESSTVNPITNIRSDKFEMLLEEKIGYYDHKHRKTTKTIDENIEFEEVKEEKKADNSPKKED